MSDDMKKKIDGLRDILVGKIPVPQDQVEQITTGLVYKFMYDIDKKSLDRGGEALFFVGDFEKYSWKNLFDPKIGGDDKVKLYREAIESFYNHPTAPGFFRDIFKNISLPFKDPRTLIMFLGKLNEFEYSHSEKLGDAYEYLLSFMGSQGDAGQFRTPSHIIDFIVSIVNPQKHEKILDPACGTAGFLISAFKHISKENLSANDRENLLDNLVGYDIAPDMVRLSLVNMYLHRFVNPKIEEYDTLSSEEKWGEHFDVILANPPFFSPRGGVSPHSRFGVKSTKAEVLFVDYMMTHLKPNGRAGIIVPEGIIFQTGTAYRELRKMLVENHLVGVISLPAGVFKPYSGVKTSILILDRKLHSQTDKIFFAKVENDGYDLGATRRPIDKNDLDEVSKLLTNYFSNQNIEESHYIEIIEKEKILESVDFNLSANKYLDSKKINYSFPASTVGEVCRIRTGKKDVNTGNPNGKYPFFTCAKENTFSDEYSFDTEALLIAGNGEVGRVSYYKGQFEAYQRTYVLDAFDKITPRFLYFILQTRLPIELDKQKQGNTIPYIKVGMLRDFEIPLPPIEIQEKIVEELKEQEKVIEDNKKLIEIHENKMQSIINKLWGEE